MSIDTDYTVLRHVLDNHTPQGWAVEFGVYQGHSLGIIANRMPVIGLDSFEGLPEDWRPGFPKGKFHKMGFMPTVPANAMIVPGLFEDSLRTIHNRGGLPHVGLVHIDCDLYSSTVTALEGIAPYIGTDTIIVFDEYHGYEGWQDHEAKAWKEFCYKHVVLADQIAEGPQEAAFIILGAGSSH